jgi:antitoxin component HigA of HigAB toxin-antitoxin module
MNIKLIKTESDYRKALKRLDALFDAKRGTPGSEEADILGLFIDEYEKKHYPIADSGSRQFRSKQAAEIPPFTEFRSE